MTETLQATVDQLVSRFGAQSSEFRGQVRVILSREQLLEAIRVLRTEHGFELLSYITAVDYWPAENPRMHVLYGLTSIQHNYTLTLRIPLEAADLRVPSIESEYLNANWYERELFDMFGIQIDGHSDLRRILMPHDWVGHPLRKDYPLGYEEVEFTFNYQDISRRKPKPQD